jgi:hypothetical protein
MIVCVTCNEEKELSCFREGRKKCKKCDGKRRYSQKLLKLETDPEFVKYIRGYDVKRQRRREKQNPVYFVKQILRESIRGSVKRIIKYSKNSDLVDGKRTEELLGGTFEEIKIHFESLFTEGMSWDNRSEWHIDHIIPLSSGKTEEEMIKLCHYTNLQPLC